MTQTAKSGRASKKGSAAVRAEKAKSKSVKFRGETLQLPDELPPTLLFDITEVEAADDNPMPVFRMLRSLLGAEQFVAVRNKIAVSENEDFADVGKLVEAIFAQYGVSAGEAPASPAP